MYNNTLFVFVLLIYVFINIYIMTTLFNKLKRVREIIGNISQGEMAKRVNELSVSIDDSKLTKELNLHQKDISQIEKGARKNIPPEYWQFLFDDGVDLNTIFDPAINEIKLRSTSSINLEECKAENIRLKGMVDALHEVINGKGSSKVKSA